LRFRQVYLAEPSLYPEGLTMRTLILAASVCGLLLVAAGATGAHMVAVEDSGRWDGAVLYGFVHTLAALGAAVAPLQGRLKLAAGWSFIAGVVLFSGIQIARLLAPGVLDAIGALVPAGGIAFMLGWVLLGTAGIAARRSA
jgi:uncharacterized membrane protein YgdD (TMEM256/DUF423 family)